MSAGIVKWFNRKKGFGFIANDDGLDVFVHFSEITGSESPKLNEGDLVIFDMVQGEMGPKACKVVKKN